MSVGQNLIRITFITMLIASLVVSVCQKGNAADKLPATAEEISPLQAGDAAPSFTVRTVDNQPYEFDPKTLERPTVIITFRGGWCPFCNMHLSDLRHVTPELKARGFDVLFLSNDRPELLYESLNKETQESIDGLDYLILSDADLNAARALGTAFTVSDRLVQRRNEKGDDIEGSSIDQFKALAVPAVVLVDLSGDIRYFYANPDYKVRLSADDLKKAADELLTE
jgi:peroxiredoxin